MDDNQRKLGKRMIRNERDLLGLIFVLAVFLGQVAAFIFVESLWVLSAIVLFLLPLQTSVCACNHNHHHCNTFRQRWLNRLFEAILYFQTGTSPLSWTLHHVIGHHQNFLDPAKDTSPWLKANGQVMGRVYYCLRNSIMMYPEIWRIGKDHPKIFRRFLVYFLLCNSILAALIFVDPLKTTLIFVFPMVCSVLMLVDNTYDHHVGLDTGDLFRSTKNLLDPFYNTCSWNLGYHTAHHLKPGLHWSGLPDFHATIGPRIPDDLITYRWGPSVFLSKIRKICLGSW